MVTVRRNYRRVNRKSIKKDTRRHGDAGLALDPTTVDVLTAHRARYATICLELEVPPRDGAPNRVVVAADLLCWLRLLCLDDSLAEAEPKTLRYRIPHTAVRIVRGRRKRKTASGNLALGPRPGSRVPGRVRPLPT